MKLRIGKHLSSSFTSGPYGCWHEVSCDNWEVNDQGDLIVYKITETNVTKDIILRIQSGQWTEVERIDI